MLLIHHPNAEAYLIEDAQYYERQMPTLGAQFLDAIDRAVAIILSAPARWRPIEADVRRFPLPRFPFAICYCTLPDHVRILAVKHYSRHPDCWRSQLSN